VKRPPARNHRFFPGLVLSGLLVLPVLHLAAEDPSRAGRAVNGAAASRSLDLATGLLGSGDWAQASFEAQLGATYDPSIADFPYVEALSLLATGAPRADIIGKLENALSQGRSWRAYDRNEAVVLCARLYAETGRNTDALSLLDSLKGRNAADGDYARALALYNLKRYRPARALISSALDSWPFDSRFPRLFLQRERGETPTDGTIGLAAAILSRLYVWQNEDRELLLLAVPFEPDPAVRDRNIRIYRSMGKADSSQAAALDTSSALSPLLALEYGVIDEKAALEEVFAGESSGIPLCSLQALCRLSGPETVRLEVAKRLASFAGVITDDANGDGIVDSVIQYRLGRPVRASFDPDQDGYPDCTVDCDLGEPAVLRGRLGNPEITYDAYPSVRTVTDGLREYTMKPLALAWAPVEWVRQDFSLQDTDFFTIRFLLPQDFLTERLLIGNASFYTEPDPARKDGIVRVVLVAGVRQSSESRSGGQVYSRTSYVHGFPSVSNSDRDGDGRFETVQQYGKDGKPASLLVDNNGNRTPEYRESWLPDGTDRMQWDSDENGAFEVSWTGRPDGSETTEWMHPLTGRLVTVSAEKGTPRSVTYGDLNLPVLHDPVADVWWVGRIPSSSREIVGELEKVFNQGEDPVVSSTIFAGGHRVYAVSTGGHLYAELLDE